MTDNPYQKFEKCDLILRDHLAIDRTRLANERTLMAYTRTALTLIIVGLTFLHFIPSGFLLVAGIVFIPLGILVGLFGGFRFVRMKRKIAAATHSAT